MSTTEPEQTDRVLRWKLNGREYELRPHEVALKVETECRSETGLTPLFLYNHPREQFGRDVIAALVWLARRQAGAPAVQQIGRRSLRLWDEVTEEVSWAALGTFEWVGDDEEPADPETSAGS